MNNYHFVCCDTGSEKGKVVSPKFAFVHHAQEWFDHVSELWPECYLSKGDIESIFLEDLEYKSLIQGNYNCDLTTKH